jgi:predicted TIM-barrel fold metal-dependent hydrolase
MAANVVDRARGMRYKGSSILRRIAMFEPVIDADGHVVERDELIFKYLEAPYGNTPEMMTLPFFPALDGWHRIARRLADGSGKTMPAPDASTWLRFVEAAKVEFSVLYPTTGLGFGLLKDKDWAVVLARAYNSYLYGEFLSADPQRLKGVALIPLQDIPEAVKELRRAVTELGMVGAVLPAVGLRRPFGDACYDPVYEEAQRLGVMLAVHGAPATGLGFDFFDRLIEARALSHPLAQIIQLTSIVMNGVLGRFPRLRMAFLEAGAGWVPFMRERLDRECRNRRVALPYSPGEQIRSAQFFVQCELDEELLPTAVEALGADCFVCASDFPHEPSEEFIEAVEAFWKRPDLSQSDKAKILVENPRRLYRLSPGPSS